jgi:hypothetical protein
MKHTLNITMALITFTLLFVLSACSSKPLITQETITVQSSEQVSIKAKAGAQSYKWRQLSGMSVVLVADDTDTLQFVAPEVNKEETLVFEVEAKFGDTVQKALVTVVVSPLGDNTDDNTTDGDNDDTNSSSSGGSDDNTTDGNNDDNTTIDGGTGGDTDNNATTTPTVTLTLLKLTINKISLNKDKNTTVKVMATYSDGTSKEITDKVEWVVTPSDAVKVTNTTLTALKDTSTTVKAKLGAVTSDAISLNIYWEVNGHTLPPEPDKAVNDSTLLGIDSNDNGVRDDVERWIYETYKDKHPIHIDIGMQSAKARQKILEQPDKAKEIHDFVSAPIYCEGYYRVYAKIFGDHISIQERINGSVFDEKTFNTKAREDAYWEYDTLLSGDSYTVPKPREGKNYCDFNTSKYTKDK